MAEAAGLALGAVALIIPTYNGYKRCAELLRSILHPTEDLKSYIAKFFAQKYFFEMETEALLSGGVSNKTVQAMLKDKEHPKWKDQKFIAWCAANISESLAMALYSSRETLEEISERLLKGTVSKGETSNLVLSSAGSSNHIQQFIDESRAARRGVKCRFDWAIAGKSRVKELLSILKQQNQDLRRLRKQNSELQKIRRQKRSAAKVSSSSETESSSAVETGTVTEVFTIRDFAQRLHEGLSLAAPCSCHNVNLRLESNSSNQITKDHSARRTNFRLVISPDTAHTRSEESQPECICILVESEWQMEEEDVVKTMFTTAQRPSINSSWKRKASEQSGSDLVTPRRTAQRLQIAIDTITENAPLISSQISDNVPPPASISMITNLCSVLKSARQGLQSPHYLGFIRNKHESTSCQHLLYKETTSYSPSSRMSLSNLLSASGKQHLPPLSERLRMARTLALSILQFGSFSSSWFQEHWRSGDISFFLDEWASNGRNRVSTTGSAPLSLAPHITALFETSNSQPSRHTIARNNQLFSLAIVLTEIATGQSLSEIGSPKGITNFTAGDPIWEYIKLQEIINTQRLAIDVSPKYAKVVERCFYCDFGLGEGDFTKKDLQMAFLSDVVIRLQECVIED